MSVLPEDWPLGVRLETFGEVDSTNRLGLERLASGDAGPLWLRAEVQTAGRGRAGRAWTSPAGNLYATYVARLPCPAWTAAQLSLVAGVAVVAAVKELAPSVAPQLKWPNDVLVSGAKLAGILVESRAEAESVTGVVIGCGVNLVIAPAAPDRPTTSLAAYGHPCTPEQAHGALARHLSAALGRWDHGNGFASIRQDWLAAGLPLGTAVSVKGTGGPLHGRFAGLADDGSLLMTPDAPDETGVVQRITFGDVEVRQT
jgi:BirA family transcriptional regulator, biotin operon repressor / biotin---[acetyl-CoA-carboxylase] ligase